MTKKILEAINLSLLRAFDQALRNPLKVVFFFLCVVVSGFYLSLRIPQAVAIRDLLEPKMSTTKDLQDMQDQFGSSDVLLVTYKNIRDSKRLCQLEVAVNEVLLAQSEVESYLTPLQMRKTTLQNGKLLFERLVPNPCERIATSGAELDLLRNTPWNWTLTDRGGTDYTVLVHFKETEGTGDFGHLHPQAIRQAILQMKAISSEPVFFSGNTAHGFYSFEGMQQSRWLNLFASLVILLGLRVFLGTWMSGVFYFLTLAGTMSFVLGGMALLDHPMDLLTGCLFLMIMISTLQDFVFLSCSAIDQPKLPWRGHFQKLLMPSFLTSLTTFIGFITLLISDLGMIRRFGFWAALAAILEWVFVFFVFPCLLEKLKIKSWVQPSRSWRPVLWERLRHWTPPKRLVQISVLAVLVPIFFGYTLRLTQSPLLMFPETHTFQQALRDQEVAKGWLAQVYLQSDSSIDTQRKSQILSAVRADPSVFKIETFRQDSDFLLQSILDLKTKEDLREQMKRSSFGNSFISAVGTERAFVYLKTAETLVLNRLTEKVQNLCPQKECWLAGEYVAFAEFSSRLISTLFQSLFLSLFLVGMILLFIFRAFRIKDQRLLLVSVLWGPFLVFSELVVSGGHINVVTCIVASILVGLAGDNLIQFIYASEGLTDSGIFQRSSASMISTVLMTALSFVFVFSYFQPPRDLGAFMALGFVASLIGDLWILKGLLAGR